MKTWVILPLIASITLPLRAESGNSVVGARPGYVFDVEGEKNQRIVELVLIDPPPPEPTLQEKIFDEKLTKDIRQQYEVRFGRTAIEQTLNAPPSRNDTYTVNGTTTVNADVYQRYQQGFANYMLAKVTETQADKFFKSDPSLRPIYAAKDRYSNFAIQTKSGYKFTWHYNLAGNTMEGNLENPYHIETKVLLQFYPFSPLTREEIIMLGYPINTLYKVSSSYKVNDGVLQLVGTRKITKSVSANVTGSTTTTPDGPSIRQTMGLVGISWTQ